MIREHKAALRREGSFCSGDALGLFVDEDLTILLGEGTDIGTGQNIENRLGRTAEPDRMGDDGILTRATCKIRRHNPEGDLLFINGKVVKKRVESGRHLVDIEQEARTQDGELSIVGAGTVEVPAKGISKAALPLDGIRVLDLSRVLAGPYCAPVLADMGADVIKIENPASGDDSRSFTEPNYKGHSVYFLTVNRNKRSVALDLKVPAGREAFLKLVARADVVVENFRTHVMERLGLSYETLKAPRPSLVYCAISGYGRDGPNVDVPGYDPVAQAESGLMSMIAEPDGPPTRVGASIIDLVCGLYAAQAVCAALRH